MNIKQITRNRLNGVINLHPVGESYYYYWKKSRNMIHPGNRKKKEEEIKHLLNTGIYFKTEYKNRITLAEI